MTKVFIIEGLDRLGKSTLIEGILRENGFHQVIHYERPKLLQFYMDRAVEHAYHLGDDDDEAALKRKALFMYQYDTFDVMCRLITSGAYLILDRAHLGEYVYAPIYRGYDGNFIFDLERSYLLNSSNLGIRLILLTEDFEKSKHFVDDGKGLGTEDKRPQEQARFIEAFNKSIIADKKMICVTDPATGSFRSKEEILKEALS